MHSPCGLWLTCSSVQQLRWRRAGPTLTCEAPFVKVGLFRLTLVSFDIREFSRRHCCCVVLVVWPQCPFPRNLSVYLPCVYPPHARVPLRRTHGTVWGAPLAAAVAAAMARATTGVPALALVVASALALLPPHYRQLPCCH